MEELKPCPFCGENLKIQASGAISESEEHPSEYTYGYLAYCQNCGSETRIFDNPAKARESWNTRPREDALSAELREARARIAQSDAARQELFEALVMAQSIINRGMHLDVIEILGAVNREKKRRAALHAPASK